MVTHKDLANALREGAKKYPHVTSADFIKKDGVWCACADGMILAGLCPTIIDALVRAAEDDGADDADQFTNISDEYESVLSDALSGDYEALYLSNNQARCPAATEGTCVWLMYAWGTLRDLVIHLNDSHKWSPEQIAAWLESLDATKET